MLVVCAGSNEATAYQGIPSNVINCNGVIFFVRRLYF